MTIDTNALEDRLYADALAADLCMPERFFAPKTKVAWSDIELHLRDRAEVHRKDLLLSPASMEVPFNRAREKWCATTSFGANSHRSRGGDDPPRRGVSRLVSAARHLLRADGRQMVLNVDRKEPGREILRWRFVSLALPPGILVAAASEPGGAPPERVRILHPSIAPDNPVAHQHVHHAAMMSFEELWVTVRRRALVQAGELQSHLRIERAFCPGLHRGTCLGGREPERSVPPARDIQLLAPGTWKSGAVCYIKPSLPVFFWTSTRDMPNRSSAVRTSVVRRQELGCEAFIAGRTSADSARVSHHPWTEELLREEGRFRSAMRQGMDPGGIDGRAVWTRRETLEESRRLVRAFSHLRLDKSETRDDGVRGSVAPVPPGQGCPLPFARPFPWGAGAGKVSRSLSADQGLCAGGGCDEAARAE